LKSGIKGRKEVGLGNMGYRPSDQLLNFSTISLLHRPKAPNIKGLKQVGRIRWYIEYKDIILPIEYLEIG
jgi:hypothetical protein